MDNYKFVSLLENSGLSVSEKYDLNTIFNNLTDSRKVDIINNWPKYLEDILKIKFANEEDKRRNFEFALKKIHELTDEAVLRQREIDQKEKERIAQEKIIRDNAMLYDQQRKLKAIQDMAKKQG